MTITMKQVEQKNANTCIVPGCTRPVYTRGNCNSCYQTLRKAVKNGEITESDAVKAGVILPAGRSARSPMAKAIEQFCKPVQEKKRRAPTRKEAAG